MRAVLKSLLHRVYGWLDILIWTELEKQDLFDSSASTTAAVAKLVIHSGQNLQWGTLIQWAQRLISVDRRQDYKCSLLKSNRSTGRVSPLETDHRSETSTTLIERNFIYLHHSPLRFILFMTFKTKKSLNTILVLNWNLTMLSLYYSEKCWLKRELFGVIWN